MKRMLPALVLCLPLLACAHAARQDDGDYTLCTHVIDGGTITVQMGACLDHVRLIGVSAPKPPDSHGPGEPFGSEAREFARSLVEGKRVRLEFDEPLKDANGQFLVYVYLEDGTLVNAEMIRRGYAAVRPELPFKLREQFLLDEQAARDAGLGLWNKKTGK